jgi:predicted DNA repair protein MutK
VAGTSLLALLDDITTILDDVAAMTKVATKKTAGVLGDDLALNAEQVTGVTTDRELPVVWAVAKGSAVNKLILVPSALAISGFAPRMVTPLLMIGGAFLCFEGCEKLAHKFLHPPEEKRTGASAEQGGEPAQENQKPAEKSNEEIEKEKIKGAIRTDFVLSAEIIVISLGTVATAPFAKQVAVLCAIGVIMTVGVYGLVAAIVKLDDAGLALSRREGALASLGRAILLGAPYLRSSSPSPVPPPCSWWGAASWPMASLGSTGSPSRSRRWRASSAPCSRPS